MKLFYYELDTGNFGDDLNVWIWDHLLPGWREWDPEVTLVGVGTLINAQNILPFADHRIVVMGSGVGYGGGTIPRLDPKWDIRCLRGPRSARLLGLPDSIGITDPATMLSDLPIFDVRERSSMPIFVPHWETVALANWQEACHNCDIEFVDPRGDAFHVIGKISRAPLVLAESMHAAIIADTFRVPWIPTRIGRHFLASKWQDFLMSSGIEAEIEPLHEGSIRFPSRIGPISTRKLAHKFQYTIHNMHAARDLKRALKRSAFLSSDAILNRNKERFQQMLFKARYDYG